MEIISWTAGKYLLQVTVLDVNLKVVWTLVVVYGAAYDEKRDEFLDELIMVCISIGTPYVIGGDFNLLRSPADKNTSNFSWALADAFNDFISSCALREIPRVGSRYTWTNHQPSPIHSVLDRVLVCSNWDSLFLLATLRSRAIVGLDHAPLILDAGIHSTSSPSRF